MAGRAALTAGDRPGDGPPELTIGALADRFDVNTKTIRYYEDIGLLPEPARTPAGHRRYGEADARRLGFVRTAQRLGLALDEIREVLGFKEQGRPPCDHVRALLRRHAADLDRRIAELRELRQELTTLVAVADDLPAAGAGYCPIIEHRR